MARGDGILDDDEREEARRLFEQADLRALESLASGEPAVAAPGRPGEAEDAIAEASGEPPVARRSHDIVVRGPGHRDRVIGQGTHTRERAAPQSAGDVEAWRRRRDGGASAAPSPTRIELPELTIAASPSGAADEPTGAPQRPSTAAPPTTPAPPRVTPQIERQVEERALAALAGEPQERARDLGVPSGRPASPKPPAAAAERAGGIPTDDDISSARAGDVPRRMLHNIANAFRVVGGRGAVRDFESDGDALEARRRQMLGDKRQARGDEAQAQERAEQTRLRAEALEVQRATQAQRAEQARRSADLAERTAGRQDMLAEAQAGRTTEQAATERSDRERAERMRNPASAESAAARTRMEALLEGVAERDRSRVQPVLDALDGMSAEDVERLERTGPAWMRDLLHRRGSGRSGGGGGGGGGQTRAGVRAAIVDRIAGPDATPEERAAAEAEADAYVTALGPRRAAQTALTDRLARGRAEATAGRADDRRADTDTERLGRAVDSTLGWRQSLRAARQIDPSLLRATFISGDIPAGFTGQQIEQARSAVNNLRGTLALMRSGAAVTEAEFARIRDEMGAAATSSPEVFLEWLSRQESQESEREARVRARFSEDVVREYDARLQRERAPGARPASQGAQPRSGERQYRVQLPGGTVERPLTEAQAAGLRARLGDDAVEAL